MHFHPHAQCQKVPHAITHHTVASDSCIFCLQLPSKGAASAAVMLMGLVWAALGGSLLLATEYLHDTVSKYAAAVLCRCCRDHVTLSMWLCTVYSHSLMEFIASCHTIYKPMSPNVIFVHAAGYHLNVELLPFFQLSTYCMSP